MFSQNFYYHVTEPNEKEKLLDDDDKQSLVTSQNKNNDGGFPELRRTGKYFGGLFKDVKRR